MSRNIGNLRQLEGTISRNNENPLTVKGPCEGLARLCMCCSHSIGEAFLHWLQRVHAYATTCAECMDIMTSWRHAASWCQICHGTWSTLDTPLLIQMRSENPCCKYLGLKVYKWTIFPLWNILQLMLFISLSCHEIFQSVCKWSCFLQIIYSWMSQLPRGRGEWLAIPSLSFSAWSTVQYVNLYNTGWPERQKETFIKALLVFHNRLPK